MSDVIETGTEVATVRADKIICDQLVTTSKVHAAGGIAKSTGSTVGIVKAAHALKQGAHGVLAARSGQGAKAMIAAMGSVAEKAYMAPNGVGFHAMLTGLSAELTVKGLTLNFVESVRADGSRVANKKAVIDVYGQLADAAQKRGKTGKPAPYAKQALIARAVIRDVFQSVFGNTDGLIPLRCEVVQPAPDTSVANNLAM